MKLQDVQQKLSSLCKCNNIRNHQINMINIAFESL